MSKIVDRETFLVWLSARFGFDALLYYDMPINACWIFDEMYEDGIITDDDLEGIDPKSVYALVFDHRKPLSSRKDNSGIFAVDIFTEFIISCGFAGEIIGGKPFYSPAGYNYMWDKEAYLLINEKFYNKIRVSDSF